MKSQTKLLAVALVATALILGASAAHAQGSHTIVTGKFTLPFEVRWGSALLTPGEYSFAVKSGTSLPDFVTVRGKKLTALIMVGESSSCTRCKDSVLLVAGRGANRTIRALYLPGFRAIFYGGNTPQRSEELARASQPVERIPVSGAGQ